MNVYDTQVWKGETWVGFFLSLDLANAWIKKQSDPASYSTNNIGPRSKEQS